MARIEDDRRELIMRALREQPLPTQMEVVVTDLNIPFGRMIGLLVKLILAAIPAMILAYLLPMLLAAGAMVLLNMLGVSVEKLLGV